MNTKGASIVMMIFELVVVLGISALLVFAAKDFAQSERVHKTIIAQDLEMMLSILSGVSGDAVVAYPQDLSAYTIAVSSEASRGQVIVFTEGDAEALRIAQEFPLLSDYTLDGFVENTGQLCLAKNGKSLFVRACTAEERLGVELP